MRSDGTMVYVEMKNKHNTMNSSSSQKTYSRMIEKTNNEPNCECYLVEIIAKKSQYIVWDIFVDGPNVKNNRIKRVSIDRFYEEVTGDSHAFYKVCRQLPFVIDEVLAEQHSNIEHLDTVVEDLHTCGRDLYDGLYSLAFGTYLGFGDEFRFKNVILDE